MKFKYLTVLLIFFSCSTHYTKFENRKSYNSKGFAYIYNENDYELKIIKNKFDSELLQISHKDLKIGTLIKISNPKTQNSLILKNIKKTNYPDFYKILITKTVANKLELDNQLPLIEILEIKKNKSFVAEKAKIYQEEKKISTKAPVTSVHIANISKSKQIKEKKNKENIYILVASFYTSEAANLLTERINKESSNYDMKKLKIKKKTTKEYAVLSGPYKSINLLKNDYIELKKYGFEELDIFIND